MYKRLPGLGKNLVQHSRLYEGEDHLLLVHSSSIAEEYRRFYYSDIQCFIIRRTTGGLIWTSAWATIAFLVAIVAINQSGNAALITWIVTAPALVGLALNLIAGPTCVCYLQTAAARQRLPSLHRVRTARTVLERIQPRITQAQGELSSEQLSQLTVAPYEPRSFSSPPLDGA